MVVRTPSGVPVRGSMFFFNDTATTEIYTLSLHDALPIFGLRLQVERRERHAAPLTDTTALGLVDQDPEDPGLERRAAFETVEGLKDRDPGVLGHLLGHRPCRDIAGRDPHHARLQPPNEVSQCCLIASPQRRTQPSLSSKA